MQAPWVGNPPEYEESGRICETCGCNDACTQVCDNYSNEYWFCNEDCLYEFVQYNPSEIVNNFLEIVTR